MPTDSRASPSFGATHWTRARIPRQTKSLQIAYSPCGSRFTMIVGPSIFLMFVMIFAAVNGTVRLRATRWELPDI